MLIILYVGIIGLFIGSFMFILSGIIKTNGSDMPLLARIGIWIFIISVILALIGVIGTSEIGKVLTD